MFDTLAVAQQLAVGGVDRDQAEVIAKASHDGLIPQTCGNRLRLGRHPRRCRQPIPPLKTSTPVAQPLVEAGATSRLAP